MPEPGGRYKGTGKTLGAALPGESGGTSLLLRNQKIQMTWTSARLRSTRLGPSHFELLHRAFLSNLPLSIIFEISFLPLLLKPGSAAAVQHTKDAKINA